MKIDRMRKLLKKEYAREFLLGKRIGNIEWEGIIPDIFNEESDEMGELIKYLSGVE